MWPLQAVFLVLLFLSTINVVHSKSSECEECEFAVDLMHKVWGENTTEMCVGDAVYFICENFHIEDHFVCQMIVSEFEPEAVYILGQIIFEPHQLCGLLLEDCGKFFDPFEVTWRVPMPPNKPPVVEKQPVQAGQPTLRVLHLTDIHMDTQYLPGAEADCGEPQCCRPSQDPQEITEAGTIKQPAGQWGTVGNCDVPYPVLLNMMQFIQKTHKDIDYVVVSGDLMSHAWYEATDETHAAMVKNISDTIRTYMGSTPVYFAVGNHEGIPVDNFAPHFAPRKWHMDWLYDAMASAWQGWIPSDQLKTVKYMASYMVKLFNGLRVLSINNPLGGDSINFWMYMNQTDPDGLLDWVIEQLKDAEAAGDKVHIVAHIPGADIEALEGWAINYYNVVNRFENTIAAQFFGHTHSDEFYITYENISDASSRPTGVVYSAPSVTTYTDYFPAYRIYTIDGVHPQSTYQVIDYEEWIFNLTTANSQPHVTPTWTQMFASINKELGLSSQIPGEWSNLINRMKTDQSLFEKYYEFRSRRNKYDGLATCNEKCKNNMLCSARQFHHDKHLCYDIEGMDEYKERSPMYRKKSTHVSPNRLQILEAIKMAKQRAPKKDPNCKF